MPIDQARVAGFCHHFPYVHDDIPNLAGNKPLEIFRFFLADIFGDDGFQPVFADQFDQLVA